MPYVIISNGIEYECIVKEIDVGPTRRKCSHNQQFSPTWYHISSPFSHPIRVVEQGNYHMIVVTECAGL